MNNSRFYKVVIVILVVLNIGTLTFLWFGHRRSGQDPERGQASKFLIRELQLTPGQQDEFGDLRDLHQKRLLELQERDRVLHDRFFEAIFLPVPDTLAATKIADSIADIRRQMEMLTFEHFNELRQLLTQKQIQKFHQIFRQALERVMPLPEPPSAPPPPPPPAPPPGGRK